METFRYPLFMGLAVAHRQMDGGKRSLSKPQIYEGLRCEARKKLDNQALMKKRNPFLSQLLKG